MVRVGLDSDYEVDDPHELAINGVVNRVVNPVFKSSKSLIMWGPKPVKMSPVEFKQCEGKPATCVEFREYYVAYHLKVCCDHIHVFPREEDKALSQAQASLVAHEFISSCLQKGVAKKC